METRSYRFGELREKLRESANEFKPKLGDGVESTEKAQNRKAYQDMEKETGDYNKGIKPAGGDNTADSVSAQVNMGMSDIEYDDIPDKRFNDNAKAGYEGYTSALEKENHGKEELGNASRNDKLAKALVDKAKQTKREKDSFSEVGLTNIQKPKDATHLHQAVVESKTSILKFKHVQFISESHMLSHVPDEYKKEGRKFYMQDCKGNKYLVEWHEQPNVEKQLNESKVGDEMKRIKELFSYSGKPLGTSNGMKINESNGVSDMIGRVRKLMK
jgi:hypothetical protein